LSHGLLLERTPPNPKRQVAMRKAKDAMLLLNF
jgi:hypothetical protein